MNVVEVVVQRYWKLGQAWRRGIGGENYTYETFMEAIREVTWHQSKVAYHANDLLQDVIRDKRDHHTCEAQIYQFPLPMKMPEPITIDVDMSALNQLEA